MLYDHSAVILANFQHHIAQQGYDVIARFPREINVREVSKHKPEVIVLAMQKNAFGNALECMIEVHDDPLTVHIPVIVATPIDETLEFDLPEVGMSHVFYTPEPFNIDHVIDALNALDLPDSNPL